MSIINFCGNEYFFDSEIIHNYLLEKGIIISMMNSSKYNFDKCFDVINNAYILLLDISDKIESFDVLESEFKFLEDCCDELVNRKIVDIAKECKSLDDKKKRLIKLLDKVNMLSNKYNNLSAFLATDILKINNIIDDTIIYKLIEI